MDESVIILMEGMACLSLESPRELFALPTIADYLLRTKSLEKHHPYAHKNLGIGKNTIYLHAIFFFQFPDFLRVGMASLPIPRLFVLSE